MKEVMECDYAGCRLPAQGDGRPFCVRHHNTDEGGEDYPTGEECE